MNLKNGKSLQLKIPNQIRCAFSIPCFFPSLFSFLYRADLAVADNLKKQHFPVKIFMRLN